MDGDDEQYLLILQIVWRENSFRLFMYCEISLLNLIKKKTTLDHYICRKIFIFLINGLKLGL